MKTVEIWIEPPSPGYGRGITWHVCDSEGKFENEEFNEYKDACREAHAREAYFLALGRATKVVEHEPEDA